MRNLFSPHLSTQKRFLLLFANELGRTRNRSLARMWWSSPQSASPTLLSTTPFPPCGISSLDCTCNDQTCETQSDEVIIVTLISQHSQFGSSCHLIEFPTAVVEDVKQQILAVPIQSNGTQFVSYRWIDYVFRWHGVIDVLWSTRNICPGTPEALMQILAEIDIS